MSRPLSGHPDNVIELWTKNGACEIHLLSGDITKLPIEQKMDIIMVSAFPESSKVVNQLVNSADPDETAPAGAVSSGSSLFTGDYAAMRGTVIGALKLSLGIDVGKLSFDKELDLRHHFSCWLSKPIPDGISPYKKLLCFERRRSEMNIATQISDMFRVFTPVFNNQDHTVITPLLATGHQGSDKAQILKSMVDAAAHWITAGLPLKCLKIVLYEEISDGIKKTFQELKAKYIAKNEKLKRHIFSKKYDVYISFSPGDQDYVKRILMSLKKKKSDVKVYSDVAKYNSEKVWQDQIFKTMVASRRIIAVLTMSFLEDSQCLEQYNIAMCCNRLLGIDLLAPFYVESITSLPTYMGLVQWIDCSSPIRRIGGLMESPRSLRWLLVKVLGVRNDGETSEQKIQQACSTVLKAIEAPDSVQPGTGETKGNAEEKFNYDVFISYSHKNPHQAESLLNTFKTFNENLKVFYDKSSLTTGSNWQSMLYRSLEECRCVIALLSPDYLASQMCMEEYSLTLARYLSGDNDVTFIPLCVEKIDSTPGYLSKVEILDASEDFGIVSTKTAEMVCRWLEEQNSAEKSKKKEDPELIERIFSESRSKSVKKQYWVVMKLNKEKVFERIVPLTFEKRDNPTINTSVVDLALIYANDSMHMAGTFCSIVDTLYPGLNISVRTMGDQKRMAALDNAKQVVIFVSQELLSTAAQMQELYLALSRQRQSSSRVIYLIKTTKLKGRPFFPRILSFDIACTDPVWEMLEEQYMKEKLPSKKTIIHRKSDRMQHSSNFVCSYAEYFAITKAAEDILETIVKPSEDSPPVPPILQNVVACDIELHGEITVDVPTSLPAKEERKKKESQQHIETISEESLADLEEESQDTTDVNGVKEKKTGDSQDDLGQEKNSPDNKAQQQEHTGQNENSNEKSGNAGSPEQTGGNSQPQLSTQKSEKKDTKNPVVQEANNAASSQGKKEKSGPNGVVEKNNSAKNGSREQQKSSSACTVL